MEKETQPSTGSEILDAIRNYAIANNLCLYSACEIKNGISRTVKVVPASNCHNCYSVAKAFTVTAIGILEDRGLLSTDEKIYPVFRETFKAGFDEKWKDVTIDNLLCHKAGFTKFPLDIDWEDVRAYPSDDYLDLVLSRPLDYRPGEHYEYSDAVFYLLSRIVTAKCGEKLDDFLCKNIFRPMRFAEYAFSKCPHGYPMGGTGLYISTEDMAKLGQLYLQKGKWDGKEILSERFIRKALGRYELKKSYGGYAKGGMYGQQLYLNPSQDSVIAFHGFNLQIDSLMNIICKTNPLLFQEE